MNLGVSIGNTNTRCAIGTKEYNRQVLIPTDEICSPNDFINFLEGQFQEDIWGLIDGSIISSVVPAKTPAIMSALGEKLNTPPKLINLSELNVDFSGYKSKIGDDRAVCCSAAAIKYPLPIILIDLGTATTINVVDSGGVFLGGAILAGIQTGLLALTNHTAQLNLIDNFSNIKIIGTDTQKSLASGAIIGAACIIEGYVNRIKKELPSKPSIIITGGNAPMVMPYCSLPPYIYEPTLSTDGLFLIYHAGLKALR